MIQFNLYGRRFTFFDCHLAPGASKGRDRCDMAAEAFKKIGVS